MNSITIANARRHLADLVDRVARGDAVELTRRGEPVAVVLSVAEFHRLSGTSPDLCRRLEEYRARLSEDELRGLAEVFDDVRADDRGRDVEL